jgi:hypothetical protein
MYNDSIPQANQQPPHIQAAMEIANTLLDKFEPADLREVVSLIEKRLCEEWEMRVTKAQKEAEYTREKAQPLLRPVHQLP